MPPAPEDLDQRELWFDVEPKTPDEWSRQRSAQWFRAERIQNAYRKGRTEMSEDLYQARWEKQQRDHVKADLAARQKKLTEGR